MIVVAIIGVLAGIAIPNFMNYVCKSRQIEAKKNLSTLRSCEEAYKAVYDTYSTDLNRIGFSFVNISKYSYTFINTIDSKNFTAQAEATIDTKNDKWTIDQNGNLTNTANACS